MFRTSKQGLPPPPKVIPLCRLFRQHKNEGGLSAQNFSQDRLTKIKKKKKKNDMKNIAIKIKISVFFLIWFSGPFKIINMYIKSNVHSKWSKTRVSGEKMPDLT